jgi:hypothetical protein
VKSTSAQTERLIELLNRPVSFWARVTGKSEDAELLSKFADVGEPGPIIYIIPFVLSEKREVACAAAAAVSELATNATPLELVQLELIFRERSPYAGTPAYDRCGAICAPIVPAPRTAAFSIRSI